MSEVSAQADDGVKIRITGDVLSVREYLESVVNERENTANCRIKAIEDRVTLLSAQLADEIKASSRAAQVANDTLERFVIAKSEALQEATNLSFAMNNTAILKAEAATDKRFSSVNEFRAQLGDQAQKFASRESVELQTGTLRDYTSALNTRLTVAEAATIQAKQIADEARSKSKDYLALILAGASILITLFTTLRIH